MRIAPARYHVAAIILHWVMAVGILGMLALGLIMMNMPMEKMRQFQLIQWHKSLGVLLLLAAGLRVMVRLLTRAPALPSSMPRYEKLAAKAGHLALYGWMIALPLSGWAMVSASSFGLPTIVFGWFEWPHIPGLAGNEAIKGQAAEIHELLAYSLIALLGVHVGAVVKHKLVDHINLLPRMGIGRVGKDAS